VLCWPPNAYGILSSLLARVSQLLLLLVHTGSWLCHHVQQYTAARRKLAARLRSTANLLAVAVTATQALLLVQLLAAMHDPI
jgi:hypothetical protein